jgi:uncharacterized protein YggT (Ycf19 family)
MGESKSPRLACDSFESAHRKLLENRVIAGIPLWAIVLDYVLGVIMWTLIGRFGMRLFLPEDSKFFFSRFFIRVTDPLLRLFKPITPGFLIPAIVPLYVAWFFYMVRFYLMPWVLGYSVMGMLSFPLEGQIAQGLYYLMRLLTGQ